MNNSVIVLICREDFTDILEEEILIRMLPNNSSVIHKAPGLLVLNTSNEEIIRKTFVFERQRVENASFFPMESNKRVARDIAKKLLPLIKAGDLWFCHIFAHSVSLSPKAASLRRIFMEFCKERFPSFYRNCPSFHNEEKEYAGPNVPVLNLCVTKDGVWGSVMRFCRLSDTRAGGIHRMAFDNKAPARSYLKIEEAFDVMGRQPFAGERVVDLGASPGGWTYAFLKRGCIVTAVDNAQLKIKETDVHKGKLVHLRRNGTLFEPLKSEIPIDWLASDMLISTGTNLWVLKKWLNNRWMRYFVVNIKLPQMHPYKVLKPLEDYLNSIKAMKFRMKHLYHDRREITIFGELY